MRNSLRKDACYTSDDGFPAEDARPAVIQLRPRDSQAAPPPPSAGLGRALSSVHSTSPPSLSDPDLGAGLDSPAPPRRSAVGDSLPAHQDGSLTSAAARVSSPAVAARGSPSPPPLSDPDVGAGLDSLPASPRLSTVGESLPAHQDGSLTSPAARVCSPARAARASLDLSPTDPSLARGPPARRYYTPPPPRRSAQAAAAARVSPPPRMLPAHTYVVIDSTYLPRVLRLESAVPLRQPAPPIRAHPLISDAEGRLVTDPTFVPRVLRLEKLNMGGGGDALDDEFDDSSDTEDENVEAPSTTAESDTKPPASVENEAKHSI